MAAMMLLYVFSNPGRFLNAVREPPGRVSDASSGLRGKENMWEAAKSRNTLAMRMECGGRRGVFHALGLEIAMSKT